MSSNVWLVLSVSRRAKTETHHSHNHNNTCSGFVPTQFLISRTNPELDCEIELDSCTLTNLCSDVHGGGVEDADDDDAVRSDRALDVDTACYPNPDISRCQV